VSARAWSTRDATAVDEIDLARDMIAVVELALSSEEYSERDASAESCRRVLMRANAMLEEALAVLTKDEVAA
jgi:hypothetical protein